MNVYNVTNVNGIVINRKIVEKSWILLYFRVFYFELITFYTITIQKTIAPIVVQT